LRSVIPDIVPWDLPPPDSRAAHEDYRAALARLYAFSEAPRSIAQIRLGRERKLDRMRALLGLLGSPQSQFETILVAGTKGKGSTAAMLTSILHAAGISVGRYTQPHLYSYRERTWARGRYVEESELVAALQAMEPTLAVIESAREDLGPLTTFDVGTALSLLHFARERTQVAVVEVGVGGGNDATNALEPILTVIGPVGLDHTDMLGDNLVAIARAKAGILRRGVDAVIARQEETVSEAIALVAEAAGAPVHQLGPGTVNSSEFSCAFDVYGPTGVLAALTIPLAGRFQRENAALAVVAAQLLARRGLPVDEHAIRQGLATVHWPGRFQTVVEEPLTILDGAHNPYAAHALAETIRSAVSNRPITLVLGISRDKDIVGTVAQLVPLAERVILTQARHERSCPPRELAEIVRSLAPNMALHIASSPGEALAQAWAGSPHRGATIVAGSLFLVGDMLELLLPTAGAGGQGTEDREARRASREALPIWDEHNG
jgi:dihydrofolate synthase/folylpolyglutamate synthase